ncbi:MAG: hypothetical protein OEX05_10685, partial [Chloroflexota bacterium]|nr:hypothetical protein [Chloroflexota bacterium]
CGSGGFEAGGNPPVVYWYRCAIEFHLPTLPPGADVRSATLAMRSENSVDDTSHIDLGGYAGDGTGTLEDLTAGERILRPKVINEVTNEFDVTAFVARLVGGGREWAGFNVSSRGTRDARRWGSPDGANPPRLTITYALPTPSSEPRPTEPAPTAPEGDGGGGSGGRGGTGSVGLPETATMARPDAPPPGPGVPALFGVLAIVGLAVHMVAARSRRTD